MPNLTVPMLGLSPVVNIWDGGPVMALGDLVAVDTETERIKEDAPWIYPPVVVLTAYGGGDMVDLVTHDRIPEYLGKLLKTGRCLAFHNAPFDLGVLGIEQFVPHIDNGLIVDTGLQWVLRRLATTGIGDEDREYPALARVILDLFGQRLDKSVDVRLTFHRGMDLDAPHMVYACGDAVATWRAAMMMGPQATMGTQVRGFLALDRISRNGVLVDQDYMRATRNIFNKVMDAAGHRLLSWGIKVAKDPESGDVAAWMAGPLGLPLGDNPTAQGIPVGLLRGLLRKALTSTGMDEVRAWMAAGEGLSDSAGLDALVPFAPAPLTKRQVFGCLHRVLNNLLDGRPPSEGLEDYWRSHEGWPVGYKQRSAEATLLDLMADAETSLGVAFPRTEKGRIALNEEAVASLDDEVVRSLPFLATWKEYKHAENMVGTFLNEKIVWGDGRVHPRHCPLVATGRTSCRDPNMQNPPKEDRMRGHFVADPGYVMCSCDYGQQELVALAQDCYTRHGVSRMREIINLGIDIHGYVGTRIHGDFKGFPEFTVENPDTVAMHVKAIDRFKAADPAEYKHLRQLSKALDFGLPGGLGPRTFVNYAKGYGVDITLEEARKLCALWKDTFPEMAHHLSPEPMLTKMDRYVARTLTGRLRVNCPFCAACNTKFQGLAADASKEAGWQLTKEGFCLGVFVHDEYISLLPFDRHCTARARHMQRVMEEAMAKITPDVRCTAEPALMFRWDKNAELWLDGEGDIIPWDMVPQAEHDGKMRTLEWGDMDKAAQQRLLDEKHRMWEENERRQQARISCG